MLWINPQMRSIPCLAFLAETTGLLVRRQKAPRIAKRYARFFGANEAFAAFTYANDTICEGVNGRLAWLGVHPGNTTIH